jgi:hypothetical protein
MKDHSLLNLPEKFELITLPQDAIFDISRGWTGGMGEAVLETRMHKIMSFGKYPIYMRDREVLQLADRQLPETVTIENNSMPRFRVSANITLKKRRERNPSIPRRGIFKWLPVFTTFYEVKVNKLHKVVFYYWQRPPARAYRFV